MLPNGENNTSAPELLFEALKDHCYGYPEELRENIANLDRDNPSFSATANHMLAHGTTTPKPISHWAYSKPKTNSMIRHAQKKSSDYGVPYTATEFLLEDAMIVTALEGIGYHRDDPTVHYTQVGHEIILETKPDLRPDLIGPVDAITNYCHALMTATSVINPRTNWEDFKDEAPGFLTWAKDHEDTKTIMQVALHIEKLDRASIENIMPMFTSTQAALRTGVL